MSAQVVFVRVHELEEVRQILKDADDLAGEHDVGTPEWIEVFGRAVALLSARITLQPVQQPIGFPMNFDHLKSGR